jgi:hypothetical protein
MKSIHHQVALTALQAGLSTIPPRMDGSKAPMAEWKQHQKVKPSFEELGKWYSNGQTGVGLICGDVSDGLECMDFDTNDAFARYEIAVHEAGLGDVLEPVVAGYSEKTPNGFHLLYKCSEIAGNTKLAQRASDKKTLIETRGEGGFIIVAPSSGKVNSAGDYVLQSGGFNTIATISPAEREELHTIACTFDEIPKPKPVKYTRGNGDRPGDDFNRTHSWQEILESAGWQQVFQRGGTTYYRRPGKTEGISATTNHDGSGLLWVFSTSTEFESERSYDKFGAHVLLNHNGDFSAATRVLHENNKPQIEYLPTSDRGPQRGFSLIPADQLMCNPKPLPWLIKGIIPAVSVGQIFGDPAAGKSLMVVWMAGCVATGTAWDGAAIRCPGNVIYLAGEGRYGMPQRLKALSEYQGIFPSKIHFSELPAALNVGAEAAAVAKAIDDLKLDRVSMIVIDTLHRHMGGDENSAKDFGELLRTLDAFRLKYQCTILVVHHSGHGDKKRSRGSSSIRGAWDFEYALSIDNGVVEMTCEKAKDFQQPLPRHYEIEVVDLPWADEDGVGVKSVTLSRVDSPARVSRGKLTSQEHRTLSMMQDVMKLTKTLAPNDVFNAPETTIKAGQFVCPLSQLREHVTKVGGLSESDKADSQQRALRRCLQSLRDKGFIGIYQDWAWLVDEPDKGGQKPKCPVSDSTRRGGRTGHPPIGVPGLSGAAVEEVENVY